MERILPFVPVFVTERWFGKTGLADIAQRPTFLENLGFLTDRKPMPLFMPMPLFLIGSGTFEHV
jgi:hypothetical protein